MAGPEPSEVFCAAAMCFTEKVLDNAVKETAKTSAVLNLIVNFFPEAEDEVKKNVVYPGNKQQILDLFKDPDSDKNTALVSDMIRGISAAKAIKAWMKKAHGVENPTADKVYMTGDKWPKMVEPLAISAHGFDAYNSSDIIIRPIGMKNAYFGVSLKKKKTTSDQDPTLINKAFDTIMQDNIFDTVKRQLEKKRENYFAGLVRQAVKLGYIKLDLKGKSNKQLYRPSKKVREDEGFARTYIDTKGSMKMREIGINPPLTSQKGWQGYGDKALNRGSLASRKNETMRGWVNNQLSKDNSIYKDFMGVMNKNADLFVRSLINLTLKTDLPRLMGTKDIGNMTFGFALVTGIGSGTAGKKLFTDKGKIELEQGKALDIHSILCGLAEMDSNPAPYKFVIVKKHEIEELLENNAAKIYFDLTKDGKVLLNMELRYKGGFTSQPQFFGTIGEDFKTIIEEKCLIKGKTGAR